jgi:hypothetical protein
MVVAIYFRNCCWVVKVLGGLDEGVETAVSSCKEGEEPQRHSVHGGLSIVRADVTAKMATPTKVDSKLSDAHLESLKRREGGEGMPLRPKV